MSEQDDDFKTTAILIELDCLLDTRLGTLVEHYSEDQVLEVLKSNYHEREFDNFPGIDYEEFQERYRKRDKRVLLNSMRTSILPMVLDFVKHTTMGSISTPFVYVPKVIVNTYPYDLTLEEQEIFKDLIFTITNGMSDIEIVRMSYSELTPGWLNNNVGVMVIYGYEDWLEAHARSGVFKRKTCPDVTMIAPAIYKKPYLTEREREIHQSLSTHPFMFLSKQLEMIVRAYFIPVGVFCLPMKPN